MTRAPGLALAAALLLGAAGAGPAPAGPTAHTAQQPTAVVVLAGGCYWGVESVFHHVRGIRSATSGYALPVPAGGRAAPPVEAVRLVYDPALISFRRILDVFFAVVHDPTQVDRQGPDVGPEYRSMILVGGDAQRAEARAAIDSLASARVFPRPIATEIAALRVFQIVEPSQQDYAARHPDDPYIMTYDVPKLAALRRVFPRLYRD